ncbi:MAG TPA: dockerin type I domain-containing protein [Candidatus Limnocylindrales bacterium]|nr:dockerin type I domain-containing protein [Candidatus Limnocylindrales bacterium]
MKLSKKVLRIKRKHFSLLAAGVFIGLGLIVTILLNTEIAQRQQISKSRAECVDDDPGRCAPEYPSQEKPPPMPECKNTEERGGETICLDSPVNPPVNNDTSQGPNDDQFIGTYCQFNSGTEGTCKYVSSCGTRYEGGHCDGSSAVKCCANSGGGGEQPSNNGSDPGGGGDSQHIGKYCSTPSGEGSCQFASGCSGSRTPGYCPGSSAVQCCVEGGGSDPGSDNPPVGGPGPDDSPVKKPAPPPPAKDDPKGVVDNNDGHAIRGWAFDPNESNASIEIHIYIYPEGGQAEGYNTGPTAFLRPDVNEAYGIAGIHGFDFQVPAKWCDGKRYTADVFAINIGDGGNSTLGGSTWSCNGGGQNPDSGQKPGNLTDGEMILKRSFDGRWYLSEYRDVKRDKGYGKNNDTAFAHYLKHGMGEKRNPNADFDEKYYLDNNSDVAEAVSKGTVRSGFEHYLLHGHKPPECRKPKSDKHAPAPCGEKKDVKSQSNSKADIEIALEGIGAGVSIKNPVRPAKIKIIKGNAVSHNASDFLTYDKATGNFVNHNFDLGSVEPGTYQLVLQMDTYLDRELVGPDGNKEFVLGESKVSKTAPTQLSAGDSAPLPGGDNVINIIDYNALIGCMPGNKSSACSNKRTADLNDDGVVNQKDLDILRDNVGESGYLLQSEEYECKENPACGSGKDSIQMCSLLCTKKTQRS